MKKPHLECPVCTSTDFHLHEITIANPRTEEEAAMSSAFVICSDCHIVVGALIPPYSLTKHLEIVLGAIDRSPFHEGAYGEGSC